MDITELFAISIKSKASDLHLSAGQVPMIRIDGDLQFLDLPALSCDAVDSLLYAIMDEPQKQAFEAALKVDFSLDIANLGRFRCHLFRQSRGSAGVFRIIPSKVLTLAQLGLPESLKTMVNHLNGLVLITGATGCGKSSTLAAMIDYINESRSGHIITIEDPIEFIHVSKKCLINQRELHQHSLGFDEALGSALRADPDIILVGEMRDRQTIRLALTAAETGHLVFSTMHTSSAAKTINRILDVFSGEEKSAVRSMLSHSLRAVVSQVLLPRKSGGRIPALEIMHCTPAIGNLIREDKIPQIYSAIQTGGSAGMQTLEQHMNILTNKNQLAST